MCARLIQSCATRIFQYPQVTIVSWTIIIDSRGATERERANKGLPQSANRLYFFFIHIIIIFFFDILQGSAPRDPVRHSVAAPPVHKSCKIKPNQDDVCNQPVSISEAMIHSLRSAPSYRHGSRCHQQQPHVPFIQAGLVPPSTCIFPVTTLARIRYISTVPVPVS